jgi:hypothetical protein
MGVHVAPNVNVGGEVLGYPLAELVGRGGMGVVYRAQLIAPELSEEERFRERFLAETEPASSLEHPNVVPIHDAGRRSAVPGDALRRRVRSESAARPGAPRRARSSGRDLQIAAALDAAARAPLAAAAAPARKPRRESPSTVRDDDDR